MPIPPFKDSNIAPIAVYNPITSEPIYKGNIFVSPVIKYDTPVVDPVFQSFPNHPFHDRPIIVSNFDTNYNCTKCKNTPEFTIPILEGDDVTMFFKFQDFYSFDSGQYTPWNPNAEIIHIKAVGADGSSVLNMDVLPTSWWDIQYSYKEGYGSYQIITISHYALNAIKGELGNCFSFCFNIDVSGEEIEVYFTELYKFITCETETHVLEGEFGNYDCMNVYYGMPTNYFSRNGNSAKAYKNKVRIISSFKEVGYNMEKTMNDNELVVQTKKSGIWKLQGGLVAPYFARIISEIMNAKTIYVDSNEYLFKENTIQKSIDYNDAWKIELKLQEVSCEREFTCIN
jgi:hypothetical protein